MRTKRFLIVLAAMLLTSVCAFAQSGNQPLKGDVNEDGKVDVSDIVAVVNIILKGGSTPQPISYYWHVGTDPITSESVPGSGTVYAFDDAREVGWHTIEGTPEEIQVGPTARLSTSAPWYIAIPSNLGITKPTSGGLVDEAISSTVITLADGVDYRVFTTPNLKKVDYLMTK